MSFEGASFNYFCLCPAAFLPCSPASPSYQNDDTNIEFHEGKQQYSSSIYAPEVCALIRQRNYILENLKNKVLVALEI